MSEHSESIPWWLDNNSFLITKQHVKKEEKSKEKSKDKSKDKSNNIKNKK